MKTLVISLFCIFIGGMMTFYDAPRGTFRNFVYEGDANQGVIVEPSTGEIRSYQFDSSGTGFLFSPDGADGPIIVQPGNTGE